MSTRHPYHGKGKKRKPGAHRRPGSAEVRAWNRGRIVPQRPPWMSEATYLRLALLREEIARGTR